MMEVAVVTTGMSNKITTTAYEMWEIPQRDVHDVSDLDVDSVGFYIKT